MAAQSASDIVHAALAQTQLPDDVRGNIPAVVSTLEQQLSTANANGQHLESSMRQLQAERDNYHC